MTDTLDGIDLACGLHESARAAAAQYHPAEAAKLCRQSLGLIVAALGELHPYAVSVRNTFAGVLQLQGKLAVAEAEFRKSVTATDTWTINVEDVHVIRLESRTGLGNVLQQQERYAEAEAVLKPALKEAERALGPEHADLPRVLNAIGVLGKNTNRPFEARAAYDRALAILAAHGHSRSGLAATIYHNLGDLLHSEGRLAEAEARARTAWELRTAMLGPEHPQTAADAAALMAILDGLGRHEDVEPAFDTAFLQIPRALGIMRLNCLPS